MSSKSLKLSRNILYKQWFVTIFLEFCELLEEIEWIGIILLCFQAVDALIVHIDYSRLEIRRK